MTEKRPWEMILEQYELRSSRTDEEILKELSGLPVLPDEDIWVEGKKTENPAWSDPVIYEQLMIYLAIADIIAERKLRAGVPLLLERASYGDMGETMRGIRHSLEAAYNPDWELLADVYIEVAQSSNRGARLWAIFALRIMREVHALDTLFEALYDDAELVRHEAIYALRNLATAYKDIRPQVIFRLEQYLNELRSSQSSAERVLQELKEQDDNTSQ